jgi:hypothetical protein
MSDERQAFEQLHAIPSGAEWCEKRHIYIHKNYSGLVLHPINESWKAFCEGALWQASREAVEGDGVRGYSYELAKSIENGKYCDFALHISRQKPSVPVGSIRNLEPLYTHSASTRS